MRLLPVSISILLCIITATCTRNPPVVTDLAVPNRAYPGSSVTLTCNAYDPDDGRISYQWSCSQGRFSSAGGPSTTWFAPAVPGLVTVSVLIRSARGGRTLKSAVIPVIEGTPTISSVNIPDRVFAGDSVSLRCFASERDGDSLTYGWTCSAGRLDSPALAATTWVSPESTENVTISVKVRTASGDTDEQTRNIEVAPRNVDLVRWDGLVRSEKYTDWPVDLSAGSRLSGYFSTTSSDVSFYIMTDADFARRAAHKTFKSLLSRPRTEGDAISLVVPATGKYHIVIDNSYSMRTDKLCHVYVHAILPCGTSGS